jgi:hypothetical protein
MKYVENQEEMTQYNKSLEGYLSRQESYLWPAGRSWLQMFRLGMYSTLFQLFFFRGQNVRFDMPGLEIKYACEAAEQVGANVHYLGAELDTNSKKKLAHETRMTLIDYISKRWQWRGSLYIRENRNSQIKMETVGLSAFTEKCVD